MIRPGHGARDVGAALEQPRQPRRVADGEHRHRERPASVVISAAARPSETVETAAPGDRGRGQGGGAARDQPVDERADRDADGQRREPAERAERRHGPQTEPRAPAPRRGLGRGRRAALEARLRAQEQQAEADEHEREHRRGGGVEAELVLGVDLRRERAESEQGEGAVLGQQVQRDDQAAPEQGEAELRQRHAREDARASAAPGCARRPRAPASLRLRVAIAGSITSG